MPLPGRLFLVGLIAQAATCPPVLSELVFAGLNASCCMLANFFAAAPEAILHIADKQLDRVSLKEVCAQAFPTGSAQMPVSSLMKHISNTTEKLGRDQLTVKSSCYHLLG